MAFASIEPIGDRRADLRAALIACTIANSVRTSKQRPLTIKDFMLDFDLPKVDTTEDLIRKFSKFRKAK